MSVRGEQGSGSVLLLVAVALVVCVGTAVLVVMGGVDARHRAQVAADLASIAAATHALEGQQAACLQAGRIAESNGGELRSCELIDGVAGVEVAVTSRFTWLDNAFVGRARAGPSVWVAYRFLGTRCGRRRERVAT